MKKAMFFMLLCLGILFGGIFAFKEFIFAMQKKFIGEYLERPISITASQATEQDWVKKMDVVGSLRTVKGVDVTAELGGLIETIQFKGGHHVKSGDILVRQNIAPDKARLRQLEALAANAEITYQRDKKQFGFGGVSKEKLDNALAEVKSTTAQVEEQRAEIDKKIIRAPFSGKLGVALVYPGQYLNPGDRIVNLQTLKPIFCDFFLPQQHLHDVKEGDKIKVTVNSFPDKVFVGEITTINPSIEVSNRNVEIEATIANEKEQLIPGMFTHVNLQVGEKKKATVLPVSAVTFNPYGSLVFKLKKTKDSFEKKPVYIAEQAFVTTGEMRGDIVVIEKGISVGDLIVTSGQLKLRNGSRVMINNDAK